jgi:hypothetical protein
MMNLNCIMENVICSDFPTCAIETGKGSLELSRYRRARRNWFPIALAIIIVLTIVLIIPIFQETDIHIQIGYADNIMNVWVDTPRKPLISDLFPLSYSLGAYVVNVSISVASQEIANFSRINVPIGEYIIVWRTGVPARGYYTITVQLYKLEILKDTYTISVSF